MMWERWITRPGNPFVPCLRELMAQLFTPVEAARFEVYMRPFVEAGIGRGRLALAYLWATKGAGAA